MSPVWKPSARTSADRGAGARTAAVLETALHAPAPTAIHVLPSAASAGGQGASARGKAADILVVPIGSEEATPQPRQGAVEAAIAYDVDVATRAEFGGITGKAGEILTVEAPKPSTGRTGALAPKLLFLGVGDVSAASLRKAGAALAKAAFGAGTVRATVVDGLAERDQEAFVEGFLLGGYRPPRAGVAAAPKPMAARLELTGASAAAVELAVSTAAATWLARSLANMPSNIKNPHWMAEQCRRIAGDAGLGIRVWDRGQLVAEGFGGILAVGAASASDPRLVQLSYTPQRPDRNSRHIVLLGKGITFDTGGVSLKPRESMASMKADMAGSAAVLAAIAAAGAAGVRHRVTALLALAENSLGAASYRPGDVVTSYGGTTIEIGNTDAEGRIVLADGLSYAVAQLAPDVLVDVATLTGAAALGLGRRHAALFSNTPALVEAFRHAADASGEKVWPMPLVQEYVWGMESSVADLAHIPPAGAKMGGGSIFAALFLQEFVGRTPWVHLDIAGPAQAAADEDEVVKGATGYGTRLLLSYLRDWA
jgi:leucyl aminopeptidase